MLTHRAIVGAFAALTLTAAASPAFALSVAYVAENDPWYNQTNDAALNQAFGAASWVRLNTYDNSIFSGGYDFIFVDGGNDNANFATWLNGGGAAAAEAWVLAGGALFLNAAQNYGESPISTGFGSQLNYPAFDEGVAVTAAGVAAGLDGNGAGTNFSGSSFAHNNITGGGLTALISGPQGVVLAEGYFGLGHLTVGGQTTTNFHFGDDPQQLRVNQLVYAATGGSPVNAVPEPATWAMMLLGFFGLGSMIRRRQGILVA